ncbi:MAG: CopG family ribbon-helix-helix protein [Tepidisphaerales bacterium]
MKRSTSQKLAASDPEFAALERLAQSVSIKSMKPLSPRNQMWWESARRGPGRPRKPADERAVSIQITMDPKLLHDVDNMADQTGKSRSEIIATGLRNALRSYRRKAG